MSHQEALWQWSETVSSKLPHLSKSEARVLALYSFGMVVRQSCGITTVANFLGALLGVKENTLRQRLREWSLPSERKRGRQRREIEVATSFAALLAWVLGWWVSDERRLALALDASTLGQRFTVLAVSVVYRGCAIPVAWAIVPTLSKGAWEAQWKRLLSALREAVPAEWTVIVLADRGLYAKWLYQTIQQQGWHPFLRINHQGLCRSRTHPCFRPLSSLVPQPGRTWCGEVECFITAAARLPCTLLAWWDAAYADPWLVVTDLQPHQAQVAWYGMRAWIEGGFKDLKRGGWHWHQTKMTDPQRAERLWLVLAVATLWVVSVGGQADATLPASSLEDLPDSHIARRRPRRYSRPRLVRCFGRGISLILAALIRGDPVLPLGAFVPLPWPAHALVQNTYP
jgi:hypothetical protein